MLTGGGVNEVVNVGRTVQSPTGPHTLRVHDVLRRLEPLAGVPRVHGVVATPDGEREVLDVPPGTVPGGLVGDAATGAYRWAPLSGGRRAQPR